MTDEWEGFKDTTVLHKALIWNMEAKKRNTSTRWFQSEGQTPLMGQSYSSFNENSILAHTTGVWSNIDKCVKTGGGTQLQSSLRISDMSQKTFVSSVNNISEILG